MPDFNSLEELYRQREFILSDEDSLLDGDSPIERVIRALERRNRGMKVHYKAGTELIDHVEFYE